MEKKPIRYTDTTLRDAHQSLWATRMSLSDMLPVLEHLDRVGYWSLEMWGGATFDVCLRYLNEDPWERLREIRKRVKNTRLQMLLRGQNVVGYRNYPDDVLEEFVQRAADLGIDIFRIFDALNDVRNLEKAVEFVKRAGRHAQGTLCYAISPVHTIEYYVARAREQKDLGVDSICIKDMAGILSPKMAFELVRALKQEFGLEVQVHCHSSSGMAVAAYLKAAEAGADIIDTASAPLSFFTSQPAVETLLACFRETPWEAELNLEALEIVSQHFERLAAGRCIPGTKAVDSMVIVHQIPGGMASNLLAQLKEQKAEHRLPEVLEEVPRVREDLGYPPLVTPTSQIVGVQAVMNVLAGERYKIVPKEVKDYVKGLYGRPPAPIREAIIKKILGDDKPIKGRPADKLEPGMPRARRELARELVEKEEDYISYALFPEVALKFFQWRKNPVKTEEVATVQEKKTKTEPPPPPRPPAEEPGIRRLRALMELSSLHSVTELEWEVGEEKIRIKRQPLEALVPKETPVSAPSQKPSETLPGTPQKETAVSSEPAGPAAQIDVATESARPVTAVKTEPITSPMVGTFYSRARPEAPAFVEKGDIVEPGQTLCIVEAMKLMNEIQAEKKCRIIDILVKDGDSVEYGQPLMLVEPL
ncbi:MAG: acetyl-CoA carboxylase biotin carboxyl carrier protein [candidate division WOR-3 bacterium]|uniref:Acetyl-CoA carboxylase biotin carboxyl carrier protein n=2 Tax=candidate division WOR-3 bacterium TaxID=2052148 RepID=A0A7C1RY02_UNCW3|nr:acetyl-CoA carboxylase biotin carboxyl carrier protein [candidate division WOR-3 bacterium]